mmetsp:Transcript_6047/g.10941  ORF Transcript_6047/g.10941 Transcript_6047/m.10941 type:complete len:83 (-) Transcript_6047:47-295(-)
MKLLHLSPQSVTATHFETKNDKGGPDLGRVCQWFRHTGSPSANDKLRNIEWLRQRAVCCERPNRLCKCVFVLVVLFLLVFEC